MDSKRAGVERLEPGSGPDTLECMGYPKRKLKPVDERFWAKVNKQGPIVRPELGPCWEWTASLNSKGYGKMNVGGYDGCKIQAAHRIAWELEHGEVPENIKVLHRCDNPKCVRVAHLFLGTQADNLKDMRSKGRQPKIDNRGEKNPRFGAKLSDETKQKISDGVMAYHKRAREALKKARDSHDD